MLKLNLNNQLSSYVIIVDRAYFAPLHMKPHNVLSSRGLRIDFTSVIFLLSFATITMATPNKRVVFNYSPEHGLIDNSPIIYYDTLAVYHHYVKDVDVNDVHKYRVFDDYDGETDYISYIGKYGSFNLTNEIYV